MQFVLTNVRALHCRVPRRAFAQDFSLRGHVRVQGPCCLLKGATIAELVTTDVVRPEKGQSRGDRRHWRSVHTGGVRSTPEPVDTRSVHAGGSRSTAGPADTRSSTRGDAALQLRASRRSQANSSPGRTQGSRLSSGRRAVCTRKVAFDRSSCEQRCLANM